MIERGREIDREREEKEGGREKGEGGKIISNFLIIIITTIIFAIIIFFISIAPVTALTTSSFDTMSQFEHSKRIKQLLK